VVVPEILVKYFVKEFEHTWREKFDQCQSSCKIKVVDQIRMVVDLKGTTLKAITNKQLKPLMTDIIREIGLRFPEIVHSCIIVNTPMFFENFFNQEVKPLLGKSSDKVHITGESAPEELTAEIPPCNLPKLYGGECTCQAQCIYSDKGPWTSVLNVVDWQN